MVTSPPQEPSRAELRKAQVLAAATECFRRHGFHGSSMAQISKTAGMSVGHIYHYFENKEAIIAAIVERDLMNLLTISARIRGNSHFGDTLRAMVDDVAHCAEEVHQDRDAPLMLEILAEAARNPAVAALIRQADTEAVAHLRALLREGLAQRGKDRPDGTLDAAINVLGALFEGLAIRLIRNPELRMEDYLPVLCRTVEFVLESEVAGGPEAVPAASA